MWKRLLGQEEKHAIGSIEHSISNILLCIEKAYQKFPIQKQKKTEAYLYLEDIKNLLTLFDSTYRIFLNKKELSSADMFILGIKAFSISSCMEQLTNYKLLLLEEIRKELMLSNILDKVLANFPKEKPISVNNEDDFLIKIRQEILGAKKSILSKISPKYMLKQKPEKLLTEIADDIYNVVLTECVLHKESSSTEKRAFIDDLLLNLSMKFIHSPDDDLHLTAANPMLYYFFSEAIKFISEKPEPLSTLAPHFKPEVLCLDTEAYVGISTLTGGRKCIKQKEGEDNKYIYDIQFLEYEDKTKKWKVTGSFNYDLNIFSKVVSMVHRIITSELTKYNAEYGTEAENKEAPVSVYLHDSASTTPVLSTSISSVAPISAVPAPAPTSEISSVATISKVRR